MSEIPDASAFRWQQCQSGKPKLLELVRLAVRARQFSQRTEEAYIGWIRRYVLFHGKQHPAALGNDAVAAFLTHLAVSRHVSPSTQNQAASALLFLYREVLRIPIAPPDGVARPRKPRHLPIVLSRQEVSAVLAEMSGPTHLVASLLYGSGLRLLEALQLRVTDVQVDRHELTVRGGKVDTTGSRCLRPRSAGTLAGKSIMCGVSMKTMCGAVPAG